MNVDNENLNTPQVASTLKTEPQHEFKSTTQEYLDGIFKDCNNMRTFVKNVSAMSEKWAAKEKYDPNKFKGDAFELFIELLFILHPNDSRIGLSKYEPFPSEKDRGIDGTALNSKGEQSVIQIKYRFDEGEYLTASKDRLTHLFSSGMIHMKPQVITDNDDMQNFRHFVFTTAKNLHWFTDGGMFGGHLMCYGIDFLRELVDDNLAFWESCREIIQQKKEDGNGN